MAENNFDLQRLLEKIYNDRGFDFREYRETTLARRLRRRLFARKVDTYTDYAAILDLNPDEYEKLFNDLTINVSSFFRDAEVFKALEETVLPALVNENSNPLRTLRIWCAGCATGQEPYSIAILLHEIPGAEIGRRDITILATDIDNKVLQRAREGVFTEKELQDIRPEYLDRYFVPADTGFSVRPEIRKPVNFERHDLVTDRFHCDMDLIVCRNVLIYFSSALQLRVLQGFHQALQPRGFLLLGKSESLAGRQKELFQALDAKLRLYRKAG
ncbi:protein-glutamate O-methyltransferase CheR [bacterium]|nr:protein-glutamate O-methyltransferase CheR [bacterium]MBU1064083.1 protein-glutamate O-methyltransferase CheR [bacterium]MBU1635271.1 protein-glutamate O-methyltransferase CheR [bacterium]MBU1874120.1 protein-glutamate O-methyltransferase CheR [bacterium]